MTSSKSCPNRGWYGCVTRTGRLRKRYALWLNGPIEWLRGKTHPHAKRAVAPGAKFQTVEELRQGSQQFRELYNQRWIIKRHNHLTREQARQQLRARSFSMNRLSSVSNKSGALQHLSAAPRAACHHRMGRLSPHSFDSMRRGRGLNLARCL